MWTTGILLFPCGYFSLRPEIDFASVQPFFQKCAISCYFLPRRRENRTSGKPDALSMAEEPQLLHTVRGVGYTLRGDAP